MLRTFKIKEQEDKESKEKVEAKEQSSAKKRLILS